MLVPHYEIRLSADERQALAAMQRAGKTPQQTVRRVSILLLAHDGLSNQAIADQVGTSRNLVQKWRKRFALYEPPPRLADDEDAPVARLLRMHQRFGGLVAQPRHQRDAPEAVNEEGVVGIAHHPGQFPFEDLV